MTQQLPPSSPNPFEGHHIEPLQEPRPSFFWRFLSETVQTLALAAVLFLAINFVSARIRVDGQSMQPNFHDGDYVIVNRLAYRFGEIQRGDVIVFHSPLNGGQEDLIKRVIGLPGDRLKIENGVVFINGNPVLEDYVEEQPYGDMAEITVPEGTVFVMGDNRNDSSDSRSWDSLDIDNIIGKAVFRYWPFDDLGMVEHPQIVLLNP